ncbi:MAG: PAS domain S-box protein [Nitrospirae bacterium]|nr:PAS domain S-box protein [Nitrospirota bacterium]
MKEAERFQKAFEDAAIGIALLAVEPLGRYLEVNPTFCRMTGYSRSELLARDFQSITASQDIDKNLEQLQLLLQGNIPSLQLEKQYLRKDASTFWARLNVSPVRDDRETPQYFIVQIEDIDTRRRAEQALQESQRALSTLISNLPGMVYRCRNDKDWTVEFASVGCLHLTGYAPSDLMERRVFYGQQIIHPDDQEPVWQDVQAAVRERKPFQLVYRIRTAAGHEKWVWEQGRGVFTPEGNLLALEGFIIDITERRHAEEALRESSQLNQQVITNAREGIIVYDREFRYVVWNPFMEELTGLRAEKILGKHPGHLANLMKEHGKILLKQEAVEGIQASIKKALTGETFLHLDVPFLIKQTGMTGWGSARYGPFRNAQGEIVGVIATVWDITERKRLEEQLRHAQKLEAIGQLAGGVAHEFNNMLTAIIGNLDLILEQTPSESDQNAILTSASQAARRAAMLTQQLLIFSHRTPMAPQPQYLGAVAEEVVGLLRQTIDRRIQTVIQSADESWPVLADAGQMHQVIMNLCVNARDSLIERMGKKNGDALPMEWEPRILISTENVRLDEAYCQSHYDARTGEFVRLSVSDNGSGIDEKIRHRIFEPFFTTKEIGHGTGLGLATVYGIVKQHDGWIELSSAPNVETVFNVYLPCTDRPVASMAPTVSNEGTGHGTETVLFVDDEASIRRLGQTILEHHGYTVLLAKNGEEALEIFQRDRERIRLVVLDLTMPRMSGREALKRLLQLDPEIRVLISTGHQMTGDSNELQNLGTVRFVPKPYRPDDLARSVRNFLDARLSRQ